MQNVGTPGVPTPRHAVAASRGPGAGKAGGRAALPPAGRESRRASPPVTAVPDATVWPLAPRGCVTCPALLTPFGAPALRCARRSSPPSRWPWSRRQARAPRRRRTARRPCVRRGECQHSALRCEVLNRGLVSRNVHNLIAYWYGALYLAPLGRRPTELEARTRPCGFLVLDHSLRGLRRGSA